MSLASKNRKIKNLLINPKYQIKYIFYLTGTGFGLVFLNTAIFYWYVRENYKFLVEMSPMDEEAKSLLFTELNHIAWTLLGTSTLFLVVIGVIGLFFSHRTAGPLYHFQRVFSSIKEGKVSSRVRLRPTDDFQNVAQSFNDMMDHLEKKIDSKNP